MSHNTFGHLFRVTTWGESHGPAIGCVVDGCPPLIPLEEKDIQQWLDKRKPGKSRFTTQRQEPDTVEILSGVFPHGKSAKQVTTGTPIQLLIKNKDARSRDYESVRQAFRPGHADFSYQSKYGIRDYRGGGRQSARETAARVAAGAIARKVLKGVRIRAALVQLGPHSINRKKWSWQEVEKNPFFCPDASAIETWTAFLDGIRRQGSSCGAVVEIIASGVPAGWGAPVYGKMDGELAGALMSINAVKGVEIGEGFAAASNQGEHHGDAMRMHKGKVAFDSNHDGGIVGGITTGQNIVARFAVKPASSIRVAQQTVTSQGKNTSISVTGRHDPCVGIRAVPVGEAMMACVLTDHALRHRGQNG